MTAESRSPGVRREASPVQDTARCGRVRTAIAPLYAEPHVMSTQNSQLVMGANVTVLARKDGWLHVRGDDDYPGWVHGGYVSLADPPSDPAACVVSLGAELCDAAGTVVVRLPWGARLQRSGSHYRLPDGREVQLRTGELIDIDALPDLFPAAREPIARTALRWLGAPYLWGGVTLGGVDCSGLIQAVLRVHGIVLPRDARLQWLVGEPIESAADLAELAPADLLFFAESGGAITHVALSLGGGSMIHSALANGGVDVNELEGESEFERNLRRAFVGARRILHP